MSNNVPSNNDNAEDIPDFYWPERICENCVDGLKNVWEGINDKVQMLTARHPSAKKLLVVLLWASILYFVLVWIFACYVYFPVAPYGIWDIFGWVIFISIGFVLIISFLLHLLSIIGTISWALLLFAFNFALSLLHLCWTVVDAAQKKAAWLDSYRRVLALGIVSALVLATYIDGSYRFWDSPFDFSAWLRTVLIILAAWASLFCYVARDKVMEVGSPRRIKQWTVGLILAISLFVHWNAGGKRTKYFLAKGVREHPNEPNPWLDFGYYYIDKGRSLANSPGDTEHGSPDPSQSYREALRCLNLAVELGASGYEVNLERAEAADIVGEKHAALIYGQIALEKSSTEPPSEYLQDEVKWLHKMIAQDAGLPDVQEKAEENKQNHARQIRRQRIESLPAFARWLFKFF